MADKTTHKEVDEANDDLMDEPTGHAEANANEAGEPNAAPEESALTPEQIQELQQTSKRYKDLEGEFTRRSQELAEMRRQNEQYQSAMAEMLGQKRAQADPLEGAWQRYNAAEQNYDIEGKNAALREILKLERQQAAREAAQQAIQATQLQGAVARMKRYGINDAQELASLRAKMTPEQEVEALVLYKLQSEGRLEEHLSKQQQEKRARAERAARLNALAGEGSGGSVPGSLGGNEDIPAVNPLHWFGMSPAGRKKVYGDARPGTE